MSRKFLASVLTLAVAGLIGGCGGGSDLVLPDEGTPTSIVVVRGDQQSAAVGAALPDSVVVRVTDTKGRPVLGQQVVFAVSGAGGSVSPDTVSTNANGLAAVRWVLGAAAGAQTLTARVIGPNVPQGLSATASAAAASGGAAAIAAVKGANQTATAGSLLPDSLVVRVTDANGNPVAGIDVSWSATGGGSVSAPTVATGADGRAGVLRTLGATAGPQATTASVGSIAGSPVTFAATATVGAAGRLTITTAPSSSAASGAPFDQQPQLQLRDANGNTVKQAGVAVSATIASGPGGTLVGSSTTATDANGLATFSGLGISGPGGTYTLNFGGAGLSGVSSGQIAIGAGAVAQLSIITQPSSSVQSGSAFPQQPVVQLLDANGNTVGVPGVPVTATIASGGGTLGGNATVTTDASGRATFTNLSISGSAGTRTLAFLAGSAVTTSAAIQVSAAPPQTVSASRSTVVATPATIVAGGAQSTITVTALDASGAPVSGAAVTLNVSGAGGSTVSSPAATDANGRTTAILSSTATGAKTVAATAGGVTITQTATVTVTAGAPSASGSTITAAPTSVSPGQASTITVRVVDANGNPV
ncbi:MAG: Ig-like domain-containing protein, partial [Acidobacteriota bacterium]